MATLKIHIGGIPADALVAVQRDDDSPGTVFRRARNAYLQRRRREKLFGHRLLADPVWDILLDLFVAGADDRRVSVSSACAAARVPPTTALRHLNYMIEGGLLLRVPHPTDARSSLVVLTEEAAKLMTIYFSCMTESDESGKDERLQAADERHH